MRTSFAAVVAAAAIHTVNGQDFLTNRDPLSLNTGNGFEALTTQEQRMAMIVPTAEDHIPPVYDPLNDAICFTDNYKVPTNIIREDLYNDFSTIFHHGLTVSTHVFHMIYDFWNMPLLYKFKNRRPCLLGDASYLRTHLTTLYTPFRYTFHNCIYTEPHRRQPGKQWRLQRPFC